MKTSLPPCFDVLGTRVTAINLSQAVNLIGDWIESPDFGRYICLTGVHGVTEGLRRSDIQLAHNTADAVVPDGMPLVWMGRRRGYTTIGRVYGPDLMLAVLKHAAECGYTSFFYGGAEGVADELKRRMEARFPGVKILGTFTPPFRPLAPDEEADVLERIAKLKPDLLWIGLSTPKQELLMASWRDRIQAKVMLGVGAAFDFHTGRVPQAPRWMMPLGLEWLFRLITNPRRLWKRYFFGNTSFLWGLTKEVMTRRKGTPS